MKFNVLKIVKKHQVLSTAVFALTFWNMLSNPKLTLHELERKKDQLEYNVWIRRKVKEWKRY